MRSTPPAVLPAPSLATLCLTLCLVSTGCATSSNPSSGSGTTPPATNAVSGNWQASATADAGTTQRVSAIAGSIDQVGSTSDSGQFTTSVLHFTGDPACFDPTPVVPLQGNYKSGALTLDSYTVNGQYIHVDGTTDATGVSLQGKYTIKGGCADGASGAFTAQRYAALTGTYNGSLRVGTTGAVTTQAILSQQPASSGSGNFLLTGSITLTGNACTWKGTAATSPANIVQGSSAAITFTTSDGNSAVLKGTFDPTAATISNATVTTSGSACNGAVLTGTLQR